MRLSYMSLHDQRQISYRMDMCMEGTSVFSSTLAEHVVQLPFFRLKFSNFNSSVRNRFFLFLLLTNKQTNKFNYTRHFSVMEKNYKTLVSTN